MKNKWATFTLVGTLIGLTFLSCGRKKAVAPVTPPPAVPMATPPPEEVKERPIYQYSGDRYRDPFMPAGASTTYQPEAVFDPQRSVVKGIIYSPQYKSALMHCTGGGVYFVKDDQIFDVMGKIVKGYKAKVLVDRVIVSGEADNIFELKIRNEGEEGKKS